MLENLYTESHGYGLDGGGQTLTRSQLASAADALREDVGISRIAGSFQNQRRVGGGIDRLQAADAVDVTGVGNNDGAGLQLL